MSAEYEALLKVMPPRSCNINGFDFGVVIREFIARDAALREELAQKDVVIEDMLQSNSDMTTRLTAAEQRNAALTALLQRVVDSSVLSFEQDAPEDLESLEADICAAIAKPTESGARE
jgi:hypothetical protein